MNAWNLYHIQASLVTVVVMINVMAIKKIIMIMENLEWKGISKMEYHTEK